MSKREGRLGVAMIGYAFMGRAHSQAWRVAPRFFDLPLEPEMTVLVGRNEERARAAADKLGWRDVEVDWRRVLEREDVDVVDICTPGDTHAEIAEAALRAGKHVLVEKPMANSVAEAEKMVQAAVAARRQGVRSMVGFTYRRVPALRLAHDLIAEGHIGEVRQVRAQYLQDWLADADAPLSWRLDKEKAGSGALGDIGAHIVDLTQYVTGKRFVEVSGLLNTFVKERPVAESFSGLQGVGGSEVGPVTVDDAAMMIARLDSGAPVVLEATRMAWGRKNAMRIEVNGTLGSIAFDFEDMNVLHLYEATNAARTAGFRRILVTEADHPYLEAWWPPGHGLGYEHGFTHQVVDLVSAIAGGTDPHPSFEDGLHVQHVLEAAERSDASNGQRIELLSLTGETAAGTSTDAGEAPAETGR